MNTKSKIELADASLLKLEAMTGGKLTFGQAIWAIRKCDELSQKEFAEKLGMSQQQLCDIEHDRKIVSPKLAAKYAKILDQSEKQFVCLALQGMLDRDGIKIMVEVRAQTPSCKQARDVIAYKNKRATNAYTNIHRGLDR